MVRRRCPARVFFTEGVCFDQGTLLMAATGISRLLLPPGEYAFTANAFSHTEAILGSYELGEESVTAGEKRFFFIHTAY